mgnify:FL=1
MREVDVLPNRFRPALVSVIAVGCMGILPGLFLGALPRCLADEPQKPKNVLFLFSDDQRFDTIHALGNKEIRTPVLDRLTEEGFTFTHAFIMGSTHPAVCMPSRAMLMSGRGLWRTPVNLENVQTWPEVFRRHGYHTFGVGKWHNGAPSYARSFEAGGAIFFGGMHDHFAIPVFDFHPDGKYPSQDRKIGKKFSSELFADEAIRFLKTYKEDRPFFAYISFTSPHDPRTPPGEFSRMYAPETVALPPNFMPEHPFDNGELKIRDELLASFPRDPQDIRRQIAEYYGMISHLDAQVGRILETLEETGLASQTLVIFASDNGLAVGRHGLMGKQNLYEHSIRVPLILKGPGVEAGKRSDALVYLFDLFPTIAEWLDVPLPDGVEGKSLLPVLRGEVAEVRDAVYAAYRDWQRAVREKRWKLIRYRVGEERHTQLFDLAEDPWELHNLADRAEYQAERTRLEERLNALQKEWGDPAADF